MSTETTRGHVTEPNELGAFFAERLNSGDVEGLVALYEANAILALPGGNIATGGEKIRAAFQQLVAAGVTVKHEEQLPALRQGALALTPARFEGGAKTAEVARRQPDGTWLWALDQPAL